MDTKYKVVVKNNAVIVSDQFGDTLFSYGKPVAQKPLKGSIALSNMWAFSVTTQNHVYDFLGLSKQDIFDKIHSGAIKVV